ncbi:MAG TPA: DeoR/GlpR family DNA-binding transcription regulator [Pelobium sp.]
MKSATDRHKYIIDHLEQNGKITVLELSKLFDISEVTIRKDLKLLEDKKLLFRTHGGATKTNPYTTDKSVLIKEQINVAEKERIGNYAAHLAGQSDAIIIGSGTTAYALAKAIKRDSKLTVITASLDIALKLSDNPMIDVLQLGGQIRSTSKSAIGIYAEKILEDISCGILFLGADGVDLEQGITTTNLMEAKLNQKMMKAAQFTVVLADSSKMGKKGLAKICALDQVEQIITDSKISDQMVKSLEDQGIKVTVV